MSAKPEVLAAGVRRLVAPNPSLMTGPGTNTYLLGTDRIAVVDPGPTIETHIDAIKSQAGAPITWILATHTHRDHSPGVARLAFETGAEVLGIAAPAGEHQDPSFRPTRVLADGDEIELGEITLRAVHTPGHASNHLCYHLAPLDWVITGDHVIDGSTVVIDPPDGNMADYLSSLRRLRALRPAALLPGHGGLIDDPGGVIDAIVEHRLRREARVRRAVQEYPGRATRELVARVYDDVPTHLHAWAMRSLLAHLIKLEADGEIASRGETWHPAA